MGKGGIKFLENASRLLAVRLLTLRQRRRPRWFTTSNLASCIVLALTTPLKDVYAYVYSVTSTSI